MPNVKNHLADKSDFDSHLGFAIDSECPCRPCFHHHDFRSVNSQGKVVHDFRCFQNAVSGCPHPIPTAVHNFSGRKKRCPRCHSWKSLLEKGIKNES